MKIVVVVANGLHIGYVGCYGNSWIETPHLDHLAAQGVVFDQHFAANPNVDAARRIFLTGRYQFLSPIAGAAPGFDTQWQLQGIAARFLHVHHARAPEKAMHHIVQALDDLAAEEHWLLQVESDDLLFADIAHDTTSEQGDLSSEDAEDEEPISEEDETFLQHQDKYSGAVLQFDAWIGQLLDEIKARGLDDDVYVLVTSHCGRSLGEHAGLFPTWSQLHEEIIHVPLIMRLPGGAEAGRRVFALTQPVDFLPTFCALFGARCSAAQGFSLLPLLDGKVRQIRSYACAGLTQGESLELNLRTSDWSIHIPPSLDDGGKESLLYVKPEDRWEVNDLHQHHPDWVERLEQCARRFVQAAETEAPFQPPPLPDFMAKDERESK